MKYEDQPGAVTRETIGTEIRDTVSKETFSAALIRMNAPKAGLPADAKARKDIPIFSGVIKYFPDALAEVAKVSFVGNQQHNPGQPLHWNKGKSGDHLDCFMRHEIDALSSKFDTDGTRHKAKAAWRALADLQIELDGEKQ